MQIWILFYITALICAVNGARILGVFHVPSHSHYQLGDKLLKALAERGHEVTVITPFAEKTPVKNFKQVLLTGAIEKMEAVKSNLFEQNDIDVITKVIWLHGLGETLTENTLNHTNVKKLLQSNEEFDLVILHQFVNEAFKGFCHRFKAPCVILSPMGTAQWTHAQTGNPDSPAYVPDMYLLNTSSQTNLLQRIYNSLVYVGIRLYMHFIVLPRQNQIMQKYFEGAPHISDLYYQTSLALINSHVSINPALPHVPNMIEIGGYHVNVPKKITDKDLANYLDNAKDGVILFSMGSNLKSTDMTKEKRDGILKAFSKLKQKVLWKWEDETLPNQPSNVKLSKWLPQQDVLAHPNIKLFITHGGLLSTIEAIYHGVPVIGLPVFGDQERNVEVAEASGYGIGISYKTLTEERLSQALDEILNNPKYAENAKRRSDIMHDQPMKPLDTAVFWVEYVIRHEGAPHLRSAALNLKWYQYLLLDVVAVIALALLIPLVVIVKVAKKLCCKKSSKKIDLKKKKK